MRFAILVPIALFGSCALPPPPPPVAEFLVSAGDQTYWIRSDNSGLRIRGSPLILARTGGRYYEIFVGEIDRSFPRALLSGERVFRRELATGDSAVIYDDTTVVRLSDEYHRKHPTAQLLGPDEPMVAGETTVFPPYRLWPGVQRDFAVAVTRAHVLMYWFGDYDSPACRVVFAAQPDEVEMRVLTGFLWLKRLAIGHGGRWWTLRGVWGAFQPEQVIRALANSRTRPTPVVTSQA